MTFEHWLALILVAIGLLLMMVMRWKYGFWPWESGK